MKLVPNAYLVYVTEIERSVAFYGSIFDMKPVFTSPRYVAYEIAPGVTFALWAGKSDAVSPKLERTSELGLNITQTTEEIDALYQKWLEEGSGAIEPPHDDVFGRTFVVSDPDGNLIRVAPAD